MARQLRVEFPGTLYHVTSRGNARQRIFDDNEDREQFLAVLQEVVLRFNWLCHAYCLMDNHYHLMVETVDANLSEGLRQLDGVYTQRFNRAHGRVGHVFQGRYKSILVEKQSYLLELCRYVALNPVRAGITKDPGKYLWASYRSTAGLSNTPPFLSTDWILRQFAPVPSEARRLYRQFVREGIGKPSPWEALTARCIMGSRIFIEKVSPALEEKSQVLEIPRQERFAFRPALEDFFKPQTSSNRTERNRRIVVAHFKYGYSLSEIARHLRLHYTSVSKILRKNL